MIDPTKPLEQALDTTPIVETSEKENKRNPSWIKPGEVRNPNGRPKKGYSVTEHVKALLEKDPQTMDDIVEKITTAAKQGDMAAIKVLWNYMDGMPLQATDITTLGNQIATPHVFVGPKPKDEL